MFCTVSGYGLSCYYCHSAEAGCGKELSIRLERWHSCPDVRAGGGENFCVKLIEKRGSKSKITSTSFGCLNQYTGFRYKELFERKEIQPVTKIWTEIVLY